MNFHMDSFSGSILDLKPKQRTRENALAVLRKDPRVSTFDMSTPWVERLILGLIDEGAIAPEPSPYPWHKYRVVEPREQTKEQREVRPH